MKLIKNSFSLGYAISAGVLAFGLITINGFKPFSSMVVMAQTEASDGNFEPAQMDNFAKAAYEIEINRLSIYAEIKDLNNGTIPTFTCDNREIVNSLTENIKPLADRYCARSIETVEKYSMKIEDYNRMQLLYNQQRPKEQGQEGGPFYNAITEIIRSVHNANKEVTTEE
jgi:hypothetical protein